MSDTPVEPQPPAAAATGAPAGDSFRDSLQRTRGRGIFWEILGELSSVRTAATLIISIGVTAWLATYYERDYGMAAAHVQFYQAWWFNLLFVFIVVAVVGAVLVRLPLRRRQTGFVIVHVGLILLIAGFWLGGNQRLDGMLNAWPGQPAHQIELPTDEVRVIAPGDQRTWRAPFQPLEFSGYPSALRYVLKPLWPVGDPGLYILPTPRVLATLPDGCEVRVLRTVDTGAAEPGWVAAPGDAAAVPQTRLELAIRPPLAKEYSPMGGAWLSPGGEGSFSMGPFTSTLAQTTSPLLVADFVAPADEANKDGRLLVYWQGKRAVLELHGDKLPQQLELDPDLGITATRLIANPAPKEHRLEQDPQAPLNPIVELAVRRGHGAEARIQTAYASAYSLLPLEPGMPELLYSHPQLTDPAGGGQGAFAQLLIGPDGRLHLRTFTRSSGSGVTVDIPDAGWTGSVAGGKGKAMDLQLTVRHLPQAVPGPQPQVMRPDHKDRATRWLELEVRHGSAATKRWFARGERATMSVPGYGDVQIGYHKALYDLQESQGFTVTLDRFTAGKDPGGGGNSTYASEITLTTASGASEHHLVTMNEPLHYGGVTLYQTAFFPETDEQGQPTGKDVSVFTVAEDRGRILKYLGSLVLVLGTLIIFALRK